VGAAENYSPRKQLLRSLRIESKQRRTTAQSKAARALRDITQSEIADAANFRLSDNCRFRKGRRHIVIRNSSHSGFDGAGIEFIIQNGDGPGTRLRKRISKSQQQIEPFEFAFTRLSEI
jgi:hypothetical protein